MKKIYLIKFVLSKKGQLEKGIQAFWFLTFGDVIDSALNSVLGNITHFFFKYMLVWHREK